MVSGKITDAKSGELLPGVSISAANGSGKTADMDGRFNVNLPEGTYTLRFEFVGYKTKEITGIVVKAAALTELNLTMERAEEEMAAVVVTASARRESIASVLSMQKNNAAISDGISIESIKRSPDRNVGEVLKRVSGASIQDDKFVVVRGLNDRYNIAMINGALLPSTEPDRRAFSFDVVPSSLIDNILINKTAAPDLPGDFSGGIIQVMTKDIPYKNFMNISIGTGFNSISTGKPFQVGMIRNTDYLGFDDGTRALPASFPSTKRYLSYNADSDPSRRLAASRLMRNNYGNRYAGNALPAMNAQFNLGATKALKNGGTAGTVLSLVYRNSQSLQHNIRRDYQTENDNALTPQNLFFNYADTLYSFNTSIGVMANFAYKKGNSKYSFRNILNRTFENSSLHRMGMNYDNRQYVENTGSVLIQKSLISSQIEGEHLLSEKNNRLKWNLNYTLTARDQPDYRVLPYAKNIDDHSDKTVAMKAIMRDTYRFWSELYDNAFGATINYQQPISIAGNSATFKAGLATQYKLRDFSTRIFRYQPTRAAEFNNLLLELPANRIFNDGNMYESGFVLNEITNNTDRYDASSLLNAGYAMIDGRIAENLRIVAGARVEQFGFVVNTADFSGQKIDVIRDYIDVLPSVNVTYNLDQQTNLRFSASKTVSRPEFREVANFAYYDFVRNAQLKGNTNLERSRITNLDLRYERYPAAGEIISASLFFKHFNSPIEQVVLNGSTPSNLVLSYTNPASANSYGAELEFRKKLSFISDAGIWDGLSVYLNAAYIRSSVEFTAENNPYDVNRPMQGLSPYLLNAGLQYTSPDNKVSMSALFNRIGHRIAAVGFQGYPDIYENGRSVIDFQAALKVLNGKGELKLNVADLLNQRAVFYQNVSREDKTGYNAVSDRIQYNYLFGTSISAGFSYNF